MSQACLTARSTGSLAIAAEPLRLAARATADPTLRLYLETRATAFGTNDYFESDLTWMELDSYEDLWFNYKAAFETFVTIRDNAETANPQQLGHYLQKLENTLPIAPHFRN